MQRRNSICLFLVLIVLVLGYQKSFANDGIRGRVVDLFGSPIKGVHVQLELLESKKRLVTYTDPDGRYSFDQKPNGPFIVTASSPGFRRESLKSNLLEGDSKSIDFGLQVGRLTDLPLMEITGTVFANGLPVNKSTVTVLNAFNFRLTEQAETDTTGKFSIFVKDPGQYLVYASEAGSYVSVSNVYFEPATQNSRILLNLKLVKVP
jgi:hypothetical protein